MRILFLERFCIVGRSSLLLLWMNDHRRLLPDMAIYEEADADKHERDAEPLTHIEDHLVLESYLRFLDELDEETHTETADEECSDEESPVELRKSVLVHQDLEYSEKEIAERLVKLCRMLWLCLSSELEDEAPRKTCHVTVDLRIEEVAKTDESSSKADSDCKVVKNPHEIEVIFAAVVS